MTQAHSPAPQADTTPDGKNDDSRTMPETVRALLLVWAVAIGGELIHQILTVVFAVLDPAPLKAAAAENAAGNDVPMLQGVVDLSVYMTIAVMALITLSIVAVQTWMLVLLAKRHKWAGHARRLLYLFSFFFAFRLFVVFAATSAATDVPLWLIALDGVVQIVVAVAAICGIILGGKEEVLSWTREDKELEKFLREREKKSGKK